MILTELQARRFAKQIGRAFRGLLDPGGSTECLTVREAVDALAGRLHTTTDRLSALSDLALRRVAEALDRPGVARNDALEELLPAENRRFLWGKLRRAFPGALPQLELPKPVNALFAVVGGMLGAAAVSHRGLVGSMLGAAVGAVTGYLMTLPMRTKLPGRIHRVAHVVDEAVSTPASLKAEDPRWTRDQVLEAVLAIGVKRADLRGLDETTRFPPATLIP